MTVRVQGFAGAMLLAITIGASAAPPQNAQQFFVQLRSSGGVTPLAQLVCFPDPGQGADTTFFLVAFTKDMASTERAKGMPLNKAFVTAETAPERLTGIFEWPFDHGVGIAKDPEVLPAVVGSKGHMWSTTGKVHGAEMELRVTFATSGRFTRRVSVDGNVAATLYGQCRPVDYDFSQPNSPRQ